MKWVLGVVVAGVLGAVLTGCAPDAGVVAADPSAVTEVPVSTPTPTPETVVTVVSVIDGDTIETTEGKVRIIGIDTPENGVCGADVAARMLLAAIPVGTAVTLELPDGQNPTDRHDRLLRYVTTPDGADVALDLIAAGVAVARYDSTDGYPAHPRESGYHAAQLATLAPDGSVLTVECAAAAEQTRIAAESAEPEHAAAETDPWWRAYSSCTKLKKNTVGHPIGPFDRVNDAEIYDRFAFGTGNRGDGDNDGLACE